MRCEIKMKNGKRIVFNSRYNLCELELKLLGIEFIVIYKEDVEQQTVTKENYKYIAIKPSEVVFINELEAINR